MVWCVRFWVSVAVVAECPCSWVVWVLLDGCLYTCWFILPFVACCILFNAFSPFLSFWSHSAAAEAWDHRKESKQANHTLFLMNNTLQAFVLLLFYLISKYCVNVHSFDTMLFLHFTSVWCPALKLQRSVGRQFLSSVIDLSIKQRGETKLWV